MSDIKLFRMEQNSATELAGSAVQVEKSLQTLFEANLDTFLGVRFIASEHSTGPVHGGRIDTLGLDEDGSPVIIEYKRSVNENVVNQGLFYLDWLMDHRRDFQWMVMEKFGSEVAKTVDWSGPRLLCIAGDFTRYDEHAVKQIARNIELLRYRKFGAELLMLELIHAPKRVTQTPPTGDVRSAVVPSPDKPAADKYQSQRIAYRIAQADSGLRDVFDSVREFLTSLGDDVQVKEVTNYIAFKRIKNFACLEVYPQAKVVLVYLKVDPSTIALEAGFTRDVTKIGHFGTGNLEVTIRTFDDFERAKSLMRLSYENS